jgi:hypothetical protein
MEVADFFSMLGTALWVYTISSNSKEKKPYKINVSLLIQINQKKYSIHKKKTGA